MKGDVKEGFGKVVKQLRLERGLSQQELADYSNVDRSFLSEMERGLYYPSLEIVYRLAEGLKIKVPDLLDKVDKISIFKK